MNQPGLGAKETVAVLPDQFARIALFPGGAPDPSTWDALAAPGDTSIEITGSELFVEVVGSTLDSVEVEGGQEDVWISVDLALSSGQILRSTLGIMPAGRDSMTFEKAVSCRDGCRLVGVWLAGLPGAEISGTATLRDLTVEPFGEVVTLGPAGHWRPDDDGGAGSLVASSDAPDELTVTTKGQGTALLTLVGCIEIHATGAVTAVGGLEQLLAVETRHRGVPRSCLGGICAGHTARRWDQPRGGRYRVVLIGAPACSD